MLKEKKKGKAHQTYLEDLDSDDKGGHRRNRKEEKQRDDHEA